jgi:hypothetical protein
MNSRKRLAGLLALLMMTTPLCAAEILNPGFEDGWTGWMEIDKDGKSVAISGDSLEGENSAKITSKAGTFAQAITVRPDTDYVVKAFVKGTGIIGIKMGQQVVFERQKSTSKWTEIQVAFNSGEHQQVAVFAQFNGNKSLFDDFSIVEEKGDMYFKAGVYTQNATGEPDDYDQATFYFLENKH